MSEWLPNVVNGWTVGGGHFNMMEVPDQVNAMIKAFVRHHVQAAAETPQAAQQGPDARRRPTAQAGEKGPTFIANEMKSPQPPVPDIVLLAAEWRPRAMLRAQLIEEGFEVDCSPTW